jgi:ElaB/YqjD/DUF883 family membrane-anchored ribosome-binding protein
LRPAADAGRQLKGETMSSTYPPGQTNGTATESRTGNGQDIRTGSESGERGRAGRFTRQAARNLREDLTSLKSDLDVLVSHSATLSEEELKDAYGKMMAKFSTLRYAAKGIAAQAGQQFNQGVDVTTEYVKERPLQAVGVAAGVGFLFGLLLARR